MFLNENFRFLNTIAQELKKHGIELSIAKESICIGREQWDKFSQQTLLMLSAAPVIVRGDKSFHIFASEQYDVDGRLTKYSIRICDSNKNSIRAWELDTKRGKHTHEYPDGRKQADHIHYSGSIEDIADELFTVIRLFNPTTGKVEDGSD